jgi:hypothetical protein
MKYATQYISNTSALSKPCARSLLSAHMVVMNSQKDATQYISSKSSVSKIIVCSRTCTPARAHVTQYYLQLLRT